MATVTSTPTEAVVVSYSTEQAVEDISPAFLADARASAANLEFAKLLGPACEKAFLWKAEGNGREATTLAARLPINLKRKDGTDRHRDPDTAKKLALKANSKTIAQWMVIGAVLTIKSDKGVVVAKDDDLCPATTIGKVVNQLLNKTIGFPAMHTAIRGVKKDESPTQAKAIAALRKLGASTKAKADKKDVESESDDETTTEIVTPADEFTIAVDTVLQALDAVALLVNGEDWQAIDLARLNARLGAPIKV